MPVARITERRQGEVIGELVPGALLDTAAVMHRAGIGENKLHELRQSGAIVPHKFNGRNWYRAEDLIRVIVEAAE